MRSKFIDRVGASQTHDGATTAPPERRVVPPHVVVCVLVTVLVCAYHASVAWKGWIPFDDGMLAQTAQRVLEGQLPHRDFTDVYTGGLSFLHAVAFGIGGSSLGTLRGTLLVATTLSIPVWYYVASRFTPPLVAGLVTLAAFAWSVPNYPAAMPSWYNLMLAVGATAAMLRYIETRRRRWVFIAGLCAGTSVLVKIIGLYPIAALALFLAYLAAPSTAPDRRASTTRVRAGAAALFAIATVLTLAPFFLVRAVLDAQAVIELALPPALISAAVVGRITSFARRGGGPTLRALVGLYWPLALGVALPIAGFAFAYWRAGALADLVRGVLVLPQQRFAEPGMHTSGPPISWFAFTLPLVLALTIRPRTRFGLRASVILLSICLTATVYSVYDHRMMVAAWLSVRMLMLPVAAIASLRLFDQPADGAGSPRRDAMTLLCAMAAWCSLTQFPYSAPIYFSYVAPLVIMSVVAVAIDAGRPAPAIGVPLVLGYAAFAVAVRPQLFPRRPELSPLAERIDSPRGGIYVWPAERRQYAAVDSILRQHSKSPWILALPDVPEVYFLTAHENPTRAIYDVFEDTANRSARLLEVADQHHVQAVVINRDPQISRPVDTALNDSLIRRFPESHTVGALEVRWK